MSGNGSDVCYCGHSLDDHNQEPFDTKCTVLGCRCVAFLSKDLIERQEDQAWHERRERIEDERWTTK